MPTETVTFLTKSDLESFKKVRVLCRAIDHPLRQKLLFYIQDQGQVNVTTMFVHFRLDQSVASQHLALLRQAGFVKTVRQGKEIYYSINTYNLGNYKNLFHALLLSKH